MVMKDDSGQRQLHHSDTPCFMLYRRRSYVVCIAPEPVSEPPRIPFLITDQSYS